MTNLWKRFLSLDRLSISWRREVGLTMIALSLVACFAVFSIRVYAILNPAPPVVSPWSAGPAAPQGRGASPTEIMAFWSAAVSRGDFAAAKEMMDVDPLTYATWQSRTLTQLQKGWVTEAHAPQQVKQIGATWQGLLRWEGNGRAVCLTVQLTEGGKILPVTDYRWCEGS